MRARPTAAFAAMALATAVVSGLLAGACGPRTMQGEMFARVQPESPGQPVTDADTRIVAGLVEMAIGGLGIERRQVGPMPGGRIRIVLPESQASRLPEVRKLLEDPKLRARPE